MAKNTDPKKIITGWDTRWSYCNVWEAKGIDGSKPAWSVSLIIPKSDKETLSKIEKAIQAAYEEGASILKGTGKTVPPLSAINSPLNDGDESAAAILPTRTLTTSTPRTTSVRRVSWIRIVRISSITRRFTAASMEGPAFPSLRTTRMETRASAALCITCRKAAMENRLVASPVPRTSSMMARRIS